MIEVIFVASASNIIESTVVLLHFEKLIRDDRESVALVIKFFMSGAFWCPHVPWLSREEGFKNLLWHIVH